MINVIHYVDKLRAINEIKRILKDKGYFFIHFNLKIVDKEGKIDYMHEEKEIIDLIKDFEIVSKNIFERVDTKPIEHTHKIMELILRK